MEPLDWNALRENCAGDESLVQEVLELFRNESASLLGDVCTAVKGRDAIAVKRSAHRLKGALVSLGAGPSVAAARELERMGSDGDISRAEPALSTLELEMLRLMSAISVAHAA
jgi:HPt (histidine-containing phosphotransfer) domain-containing protein